MRVDLQLTGRRARFSAAGFLVLLFAVLVVQSLRTKLYYDEVLSYYVMHQPSAADIIHAIEEGCENSAPLYFLVAHFLQPLVRVPELALRLPSAIGYCVACLCLFVFLARRLPGAYALAGMMLFCLACLQHSFEARPYGLELACAGCALLLWQSAAEGKRDWWVLPALTISLMCAMALHYFAVYLIVPMLAGEIARWRRGGRPDVRSILAISISPLILIPFVPLILPTLRFAPYFYSKITSPVSDSRYLLNGKLGYFEGAAIAVFIIWLWKPWKIERGPQVSVRGLLPHEWVCVAALAVTPYLAILIALLTNRMFQDRYFMWAVFGFVTLAMAAVFRVTRGAVAPAAVMTLAMLAVMSFRWAKDFVTPPHPLEAERQNSELAALPGDPEPIVVAPADVYMELSYYAAPASRGRLVYLASPELSRRYSQTDTDSLFLTALRHRAPVHVEDLEPFLTTHSSFLLFDDPTDDVEGWLFWYLLDTGYKITPLSTGFAPGVYLVQSSKGH
jgi:hypothetical protein